MKMLLLLALILSALFFFANASAFFLLNPKRKKTEQYRLFFEKLPRNRIAGSILAWIALLWCYPNIVPLFDSASALQNAILPFLIIVGIIVSYFADYLFARAFAAILILNAHTLLKWVYPLNLPGYSIFAFLVLSFGLLGIVIAAKPHWLRNWYRKSSAKNGIRMISEIYFVILTVAMLAILAEAFV